MAPKAWADRWLAAQRAGRARLLVVGGASLDRIHVHGEPVSTPGGAGLYTALAAARAGAEVTMLAPFPDPMPVELAPALDRIRWVGPRVPIDGLPRFEIAYDDSGAVTFFREHLGAEPDMTPALLDSLDDLPEAAFCVPFLDARLQHEFVRALAERGCLTIAGTYGKAVREDTPTVLATAALADLFFCNADEATVLFGGVDGAATRHGALRFVTLGPAGAAVFQGDHRTDVPGVPAHALDPTGAGDTFCGTTVARVLVGDHPVEATRRATAAAAEMVEHLGPSALWATSPAPRPPEDERAWPDDVAIDRLAQRIADLAGGGDLSAFDFTGDLFPAVGDPGATAWFTAATLQQFGFWYERDGHYDRPMIATIGGNDRKGSDYLWAHYLRWAATEPGALGGARQATITDAEWSAAASDDTGRDPYPQPGRYAGLARAYGQSLLEIGMSAGDLVAAAAEHDRPMHALLRLLDHVGGYREDPLRKKAALLGVILRQRPEGCLPAAEGDDAPPIVDYHVQRTSLRTGIVTVDDADLRHRLESRTVLAAADEQAVRRAAWAAVAALSARSGKDMGTVDWFLFQMRHRCPEMTEPRCAECPALGACHQRTGLFQPVHRTTFY
ncbi:MAG: carbohydrate kinase family protein [Ilumatobacter sp.]|nr:carbohydrate kinase family protein [Ilumatobacter sp.]MCB0983642.1 carbohydrate kinase family protein [Ilumatobacter sp.]